MTRTGCFLDTGTFPGPLDWSALEASVDTWHWHHKAAPADISQAIAGVEVVITNKVVLTADQLDAADSLRLIGVAATGTNNVDLQAARRNGIDVVNVAGYAAAPVSQHVFAAILGRATRIADYDSLVKSGGWTNSEFFCRIAHPIEEIAGQTLAIVGGGDIGNAVAAAGRGFGMNVVIAERPGATNVREGRVAFNDVVETADVLTLHCPLTDDTRKLIDVKTLARMKPTAMLVNTARGEIVDSPALADALRAGEIGSAAIDVVDGEPAAADHPLLADDIPNLTLTPHIGWASRNARQTILDQLAGKINAYLAGDALTTVN